MDGLRVSRKRWLEELLMGVFSVKHVKLIYEENGNLFPIIYDKGWFQYAKCTANYYKNYAHLFKRALLDSDTVYYSDNYKRKENIDRDHIIENAKRYFCSFGYSEEKYTVKYSTNDISRLLYKIIINEILPIIFEAGKDIDEDITDRFNKEKERIYCLFSMPDLDDLFYIDARNRDIDKIIDYDLREDEFKADIAIPIDTSGMSLGLLIPWQKNAVEIITKPADSGLKVWSERTDLSLDELMEKWIKYPYVPEAHFDKPWNPFFDSFVEEKEHRQYCPITRTEIKHFGILSRYVFFVTNSCYFKECSSYAEMKLVINKRLRDTLSNEHDTEFYSYYKSIADEIKEMVSIIRSVNIKLLIEHNKENYAEIVKHFNLDPDLLYTSCSFDRKNESEIIDAIYNVLEKAIYDFAIRIDNNCQLLGKEFKKRININQLMNTIENCITDESFIESICMLDDNLNEDRDRYYPIRKKSTGSSFLDTFNKAFSPKENYLKYLKDTLKKFYDCLNDNNINECRLNTEEETVDSENFGKKDGLKKHIDEQIELLKEPLTVYLKSQYKMIMFINGEGNQFTKANYNEYDKLRIELLEYYYGFTQLYQHLLNMDKELKKLIDASAEINNDIFNAIIKNALCNFKHSIYSDLRIKDEDHKEIV